MPIMNVYINGTDTPKEATLWGTSLANVLHKMTVQSDEQSSVCLDGCGVNNGDPRDLGPIFTFNLEAQVDNLVKQIRAKIAERNEKLTLNLFGFSRGGAGVFWLCQKLKDIDSSTIEINVCSFEPVPGNFIRASYTDNISGFKSTLSAQIADLSDCKNINKMLVLFTDKPLPDIACHGPILPVMPKQTDVAIDVVPGCHKNAQAFYSSGQKIRADNDYSALSFHYVSRFLTNCGTFFNFKDYILEGALNPNANLINLLEVQNARVSNGNRSMHFYNEIHSRSKQPYLNLLHKELVTGRQSKDARDCSLSIKDPSPQPDYWSGLKSNSYFPMFAKAAGVASAFYYSPLLGVVAGTALTCKAVKDWYQQPTVSTESKKPRPC